jgi:hypothetical protein
MQVAKHFHGVQHYNPLTCGNQNRYDWLLKNIISLFFSMVWFLGQYQNINVQVYIIQVLAFHLLLGVYI